MLTLLVTYTAKAGQRDAFLQSVRTKSCWQNSGHRRNSRRSTSGSPTWHAYSS